VPQQNEHIERMKKLEPNLRNIKTLNMGTGKVELQNLSEIFPKLFASIKDKPKPKKVKLTELQMNFNNSVDAYIKKFVEKHGYEFDYWIGEEVGECASFIEQYFFNFSDIKFDIDNKIKKDLIFQYQDDCLAHPKKSMNFRSYANGLRFEDIKIKK
jgi:hypothetical protein